MFRFSLENLDPLNSTSFTAMNFLKDIMKLMHGGGGQTIKPVSITKNISYINNKFEPCNIESL